MVVQRLLYLYALATGVLSVLGFPSTTRSITCPVKIDQDRPVEASRIIVPNQANLSSVNREQVHPRIVNGDLASPNLLPYMVAIWSPTSNGKVGLCTGTLVSATWVITAAHCLIKPGDLVQIGVAQAQPNIKLTTTRVKRSVSHPDYRYLPDPNPTSKFDIAVFELDSLAPKTARFMKVNVASGRPKAGEFARALGYGVTKEKVDGGGYGGQVDLPISEDGTTEEEVDGGGYGRQVDVPISEDGICARTYEYIEDDKQVCAGYPQGDCDSCQGDSGGPLIQYDDDEPVLVGVISFGDGCARKDRPGVYVRTSAYKSFLDDNDVEYTKSGSTGLSGGAIAGIVIVCLLLVTAAVVGAMFFLRKRRGSPGKSAGTGAVAPGAPTQQPAAILTQTGHPGVPPSSGMPPGVPTVPVYPVTPAIAPTAPPVQTSKQVPSPPNAQAQMQAPAQTPMPPPPQVPVIVPTPPPPGGLN